MMPHMTPHMRTVRQWFEKNIMETEKLPGYTQQMKSEFSSTVSDFQVILKNANYNLVDGTHQDDTKQNVIEQVLVFCTTPKSKKGTELLVQYPFHILSTYPVLNGKFQILHLSQQPDSSQRQTHGTD